MVDGRDAETMDLIVDDLKSACWELPVTFRVVPFDTPMICVYIRGEDVGIIMWASDDMHTADTYEWWSLSSVTGNTQKHGAQGLRAALARCLNEYIDRRIGLIND